MAGLAESEEAVSFQLSAVSYQLSAISHQPSAHQPYAAALRCLHRWVHLLLTADG
jgi:hypothetical protein